MLVMPSNNSGIRLGYLCGRYPGRIGHLYSPGAQRGPYDFVPYALDNGAYSAFTAGTSWDPRPWFALLEWSKLSGQQPRWVLVPDVVANAESTKFMWEIYAQRAAKYGPLAFAVQDGMQPKDVPTEAEVVFVGGTTDWKWATLAEWCSAFPRVHVGRVNTLKRLLQAEKAGAESCDGTGWMRGCQMQARELQSYLAGTYSEQLELQPC